MKPVKTRPGLKTKWIEYKHGDVALKGYLAYNDGIKGKRPGVLIVPCFRGLKEFDQGRAEQLAKLGYIAFAIDMYGVKPKDDQEAFAFARIYGEDRPLMRSRAAAGLEVLQKQKLTDAGHIAAIGYCFGGCVALELARSGADISGIVGFHAGLDTPNPNDGKNIKGKVLILHGAEDPIVPMNQVLAFQDEMRQAKVDWQMMFYGGAVHGFSMPDSGTDPSKPVAYNEKADRRSWAAMKSFFREIFK